MKPSQLMRQRRAQLVREFSAVQEKAQGILSEEDRNQLTAINDQIAILDKDIAEAEANEARLASLNQPLTPVSAQARVHDRAEDRPFESLGEFLQSVIAAGNPSVRVMDPRLRQQAAATGMSNYPTEGGFLVAPQFSNELMRRNYETGALISRCRRIPISGNTLNIPYVSESSRASTQYGGVLGYWLAEGDEITASKPVIDQLTLKLSKVGALCYLTDELLQDAAALGALIGPLFAEALAFKVESAIISGTGAGQPLGLLNAACTVSVAAEDGQTATTINVTNIVKMWSRLYGPSRANAVWFINQDIEPQLHKMVLATGTYSGQAVYLPQNGLSASPFSTLYGRPVIPIEHCPTLGTVGDIILADLSQYLLAEKGPVASEQSIHVRFVYDEMALRWTYRVDGAPWWHSALTPHKGSNTQSPFITLATRS